MFPLEASMSSFYCSRALNQSLAGDLWIFSNVSSVPTLTLMLFSDLKLMSDQGGTNIGAAAPEGGGLGATTSNLSTLEGPCQSFQFFSSFTLPSLPRPSSARRIGRKACSRSHGRGHARSSRHDRAGERWRRSKDSAKRRFQPQDCR